ncbi:MAG: MBL fold metallo-hydrolase, partial [Bradyrhizobiaceae bacterium]|nr:MBL fold metallo-hydrolase [Bradyrhizobiaceae bacterium]
IASGRQSIMALCDTTNHPWLFARHPEWQPILDMDGGLAVRTRKRLLDRVAADRMPITGYHFPFPGYGHIIKTGAGYDFVPAMWQTTL